MKLLMAGVNYKNNTISQREKLSFTSAKIAEICINICKIKDIYGCIIISTCNRTEIYISSNSNFDAAELLIKYSFVFDFNGTFEKKENIEAIHHIVELACGLKSQILGEEQIVSQINSSLELSRKNNCTDSFLETLFRIAVSAGKYTITNVKFNVTPLSSAYAAVELLIKNYSSLCGKKCLIIGNGKISSIIQKLLIKNKCTVFVTLRDYKHGNNDVNIIGGCIKIKYSERYNYIPNVDFIISATKSPHYTLTYDKLCLINKKPDFIIDLAVPRDVQPEIYKICKCFNIDNLDFKTNANNKTINYVYSIAEKFVNDFIKWKNYKLSLNNISSIKNIISKRIQNNLINNSINNLIDTADYNLEYLLKLTVDKTVDILLGSMKDVISPEITAKSQKKIEERTRL